MIRYQGRISEYEISPGWLNAARWWLLRRVRFSRRYRLAKIIGWPTVRVRVVE